MANTTPSYSCITDESSFTSNHLHNHHHLYSTTVYLLQPPPSPPSNFPTWLISPDTTRFRYPNHRPWMISLDTAAVLRHPLTLAPHSHSLPTNFHLSKLQRFHIAVSHNVSTIPVDKLVVVPPKGGPELNDSHIDNLTQCTVLALYNAGHTQACRWSKPWVKISNQVDDIIVFRRRIYAVDRLGEVRVINNYPKSRIRVEKTVITRPVSPGLGQFGWRKRLVVDGKNVYLVVRREEKLFHVYKAGKLFQTYSMMWRGKTVSWDKVEGFEGDKVLFMARDYYFFRPALAEFPGREYENCIVFSEAAFPQYGNGCWEFTQVDTEFGVVSKCEDDVAIFRLTDDTFAREGESSAFPEIDWSPPPWILHAESISPAGYQSHLLLEFQSQSERELVEEEDIASGGKKNGEVQSDLKDSNSKDEEMQYDANIGDGASLQENLSRSTNTVTVSAADEEVTVTLPSMSDGSGAIEQETSRENITQTELGVRTSSTTKTHISDSETIKFEGFDIRSDLVPTLQMIWRKHGNILENSIIRSGDIVARALESLATMVRILEDSSAQSLTDTQADYLSSTLSDLRCMCFKIYWLSSFVDKAVQLHKRKPLLDSMNNLIQLSSQVKERRALLLDELAKLSEEENKLKEEAMAVSKMIPFSGPVKFDEPLGLGLT